MTIIKDLYKADYGRIMRKTQAFTIAMIIQILKMVK